MTVMTKNLKKFPPRPPSVLSVSLTTTAVLKVPPNWHHIKFSDSHFATVLLMLQNCSLLLSANIFRKLWTETSCASMQRCLLQTTEVATSSPEIKVGSFWHQLESRGPHEMKLKMATWICIKTSKLSRASRCLPPAPSAPRAGTRCGTARPRRGAVRRRKRRRLRRPLR